MKILLKALFTRVFHPWIQFRGANDAVFLTFDDGPHPERTPRLLEVLERYGAVATFFVVGEYAEMFPDLVKRLVQAGHSIGFHTDTHPHMRRLSVRRQLQELRGIRKLAYSLGRPVHIYRPPYGEMSMVQMVWCAINRVRIVMWSRDPKDSFVSDAERVAGSLEGLQGGDIVLLHDDTEAAISALPRVLEQIRASGLRFDCLGRSGS